tara:strand:- start:2500 stop:2760 length:261 start_codon:yes stop_codon:yes gene_type:complete
MMEGKKKQIPKRIKKFLKGKIMNTNEIHSKLLDTKSIAGGGRLKPYRNTPSKQAVGSILSAPWHGFTRLTDKGVYPALWTYEGEEE